MFGWQLLELRKMMVKFMSAEVCSGRLSRICLSVKIFGRSCREWKVMRWRLMCWSRVWGICQLHKLFGCMLQGDKTKTRRKSRNCWGGDSSSTQNLLNCGNSSFSWKMLMRQESCFTKQSRLFLVRSICGWPLPKVKNTKTQKQW